MIQPSWRVWGGCALVAATSTLAACDGSGGPRTGQLVSSPSAAVAVRVSPPTLQLAQVVPDATCPMTQPFMTHFDLTIGPPSADVFLDDVLLQLGGGGQIAFGRVDLERLFGSTQVPAGISRDFTFDPRLGCGPNSSPGTVVIVVTVIDGVGVKHQTSTTVRVG